MRLAATTVVVCACACLHMAAPGAAAPADAQARSIVLETRESATPNGKPAGALYINGQLVVQLAKEQRGRGPLRNISIAAALLSAAYRAGSAQITIQQTDSRGRRFALMLDGSVLLSATDAEGKAWGAEPAALAETWRNNIMDALALGGQVEPPATPTQPLEYDFTEVKAAEDAYPIPEQESPHAPTGGSGILDYAPAADNGRLHPDYAGLVVSDGHSVYEPPAATRLDSARLPGELVVQVTGTRPPETVVRRAVDAALRTHSGIAPDEQLGWQGDLAKAQPAAGQSRPLKVEYTAGGRQGAVTLQLENTALATPRETLTFFSNKPERVEREHLLYHATLPARQAGRLVYHHQLAGSRPLRLLARVINTGSQPSAVYIVPGDAPADVNTFYVGYTSAEVFWKNLNSGAGYVASLPPGGQVVLVEHMLKSGQTGSGYYKLANLGNGELLVETLTLEPGSPLPNRPIIDKSHASSAVYGPPYISFSGSFNAGDPWKYLRLGEQDMPSLNGGPPLDGCYGVTHSFSIELANPRETPALVFVVLRASAGEVKGQFYINDEYVVSPLVVSGEERLLAEVPLAPGETRLLRITAMPLNGGFYPASIILRQTRYP